MKLLLLSEGPLDIGDDARASEGAVVILTRRVLEKRLGRPVDTQREISVGRLARINAAGDPVRGYEKKLVAATVDAARDTCTSIAVVVDRDGPKNTRRLETLRAGRRAIAATRPLGDRIAIGVAVETVEAWLLADENALNRALRPDPVVHRTTSPEQIWGPPRTREHPKSRLRAVCDTKTTECGHEYDVIAEHVDLGILRRRCPSFDAFAAELESLIE